ncbi:MAG: lauroyl acyltransferase, partial [Fibrobacter sp.]|nr:lauroyl acyltransferase [Fibrobacter sp.]
IERKIRCVNNRPYSVNAHSPRDFLNVIDQKELFCLLADQDSRIPSAGDGTLLGKKAKFNPLPDFLLRHRPETPSFFCWIEESERHAQKILHAIEVEISSIQGGTGLVDGPYHQWLEERIKENPYLWYGWTHRRFYCTTPHIYDFSSPRTK